MIKKWCINLDKSQKQVKLNYKNQNKGYSMQKIILNFFIAFLTVSSLNADNKPMSNDEFIKTKLMS